MNISSHRQYCLCTACWFTLARSALPPREFVARAQRHELSENQRKIVDEMKLKMWNESVKGESA